MGPRRAVAAAASDRRRGCACAVAIALVTSGPGARAQDVERPPHAALPSDAEILDRPSDAFRVRSVTTRITSFDQTGHGYQSQAGPVLGPGNERATILEPQLEIVATQGDRLTHRLWVPVDVVSAASPDAIDNAPAAADVVSSASRTNVAGTIDWASTYKGDTTSDVTLIGGLHLEEPFRSWHAGLGASRAFGDSDTVLSATVLEVFDWFDRFDITGHRHGRADRSSTTASVGATQVLTPTTIVNLNYGVTLQRGELGNTWNSVPLASLERGPEFVPEERWRHALVIRASQFLPWNGALRLHYRFYTDDWGLVAHAVEGELMQRLSPLLYIGALYRFYTQTGVSFFTTLAASNLPWRTADSDLAPLDSHTIGGKVVIEMPVGTSLRAVHFELGYQRYFRTNDLQMNVVTCATGYRF
jgi:hypothetical protein